jgi:hypothetical protein
LPILVIKVLTQTDFYLHQLIKFSSNYFKKLILSNAIRIYALKIVKIVMSAFLKTTLDLIKNINIFSIKNALIIYQSFEKILNVEKGNFVK